MRFLTKLIILKIKKAADNQFLCPITYEKLERQSWQKMGLYELETINQLEAQSKSNDSFKSPFINKDISYYFHAIKLTLKLWKMRRMQRMQRLQYKERRRHCKHKRWQN